VRGARPIERRTLVQSQEGAKVRDRGVGDSWDGRAGGRDSAGMGSGNASELVGERGQTHHGACLRCIFDGEMLRASASTCRAG
jgi:hypothetical protein